MTTILPVTTDQPNASVEAMRDALVGARKALLKALPYLPPDAEAIYCGEWLAEINEVLGENQGVNLREVFEYQLLSRLQQDCEYYLGFGARLKKHLWALDEAEQIQKMKSLYAALPEKPEWITLADIEKYEVAMMGSSAIKDSCLLPEA